MRSRRSRCWMGLYRKELQEGRGTQENADPPCTRGLPPQPTCMRQVRTGAPSSSVGPLQVFLGFSGWRREWGGARVVADGAAACTAMCAKQHCTLLWASAHHPTLPPMRCVTGMSPGQGKEASKPCQRSVQIVGSREHLYTLNAAHWVEGDGGCRPPPHPPTLVLIGKAGVQGNSPGQGAAGQGKGDAVGALPDLSASALVLMCANHGARMVGGLWGGVGKGAWRMRMPADRSTRCL